MTTTTREVSLHDDLTLIQAIDQRVVPTPILMLWNGWQAWRRTEGKRPTRDADGSTTAGKQESQLWQSTIGSLYGPDWRRLNDEREAAIADGEDPPPAPLVS